MAKKFLEIFSFFFFYNNFISKFTNY